MAETTKLDAARVDRIVAAAVSAGMEATLNELDNALIDDVDELILDQLGPEVRSHAHAIARTITTRLWHSGAITPTPEGGA